MEIYGPIDPLAAGRRRAPNTAGKGVRRMTAANVAIGWPMWIGVHSQLEELELGGEWTWFDGRKNHLLEVLEISTDPQYDRPRYHPGFDRTGRSDFDRSWGKSYERSLKAVLLAWSVVVVTDPEGCSRIERSG